MPNDVDGMTSLHDLIKEDDMAQPSPKALALAREKITYSDKDPKALKVFGTRFIYAEVTDAVEADERITGQIARMLDDFAAEQQIMNSWSPGKSPKGTA